MTKIDKNIPVPISTTRKYPFADMQIGDSFFVALEDDNKTTHSIAASLHSSVKTIKKVIKDFKITVRSVESGVRCWRVQ